MLLRLALVPAISLWASLGASLGASPAVAQTDAWEACQSYDARLSIPACTKIIEAGAEPPSALSAAYSNRGIAYRQQKEHYAALADHNKAIELEPRSARAWLNRGMANKSIRNYQPALADFDEAIRLDPAYAKAYALRGETQLPGERIDGIHAALNDFDRALKLNPSLSVDFEPAINLLDRIVKEQPKESAPGILLCLAYALKGKPVEGLQYCDAGRDLADNDAAVAFAAEIHGYVLLRARMAREALLELNEAVKRDGTALSARVYRAQALQQLGRVADANAGFQEAIALAPRHERDRLALETARIALKLPARAAAPPAAAPPAAGPASPAATAAAPPARDARPRAEAPRGDARDCDDCPAMVAIPIRPFVMGVPAQEEEAERYPVRGQSAPLRTVSFERRFSLGKYEVTRREFAAFVAATNHDTGRRCNTIDEKGAFLDRPATWRNPGFSQSDLDPVVCVSWSDAQAYVTWLTRRTGKTYRLPTEAEWEFAARAGSRGPRYWGTNADDACRHANARDADSVAALNWDGGETRSFACRDGAVHTAPVGRYLPNAFGLHDMLGNVWEWVEDCWQPNYNGAPLNGAAVVAADCKQRVYRGGGWSGFIRGLRAGARFFGAVETRYSTIGFRVVRAD